MLKSMIAAMGAATVLFAGGFGLQIGNPEASAEARAMKAAVTVKSSGCAPAEKTNLSATAIGMVNGQRRSIPLKVTALSEPGMFAITQQWPKEGKWVIEIVGENSGVYTSALLTAGPEGVDHLHAKNIYARRATPQEIDSVLK
jgi:hypothetical protein